MSRKFWIFSFVYLLGSCYLMAEESHENKVLPERLFENSLDERIKDFGREKSDRCKHHSSRHSKKEKQAEYDYVIIGAGTAGTALASQLSNPNQNGKYKTSVLVLEAGENLSQDPAVLHLNTVF